MADKLLDIEIVTPTSIAFTGKASSVTVPGSQSPFQVLINHAPIVSSLDPGLLTMRDENDKLVEFVVSSGFVEVLKNKVSVIVEKATPIGKVNLEKSRADYEAARAEMNATKDEDARNSAKEKMMFADSEIKAQDKAK